MAFHVTHRMGHTERTPLAALPELLAELDAGADDLEHTSVSVTHESEWCLAAYRDGRLVFENLEDGEPRHMAGVPPERIIALWRLLAEGDLAALEREPWRPGYR